MTEPLSRTEGSVSALKELANQRNRKTPHTGKLTQHPSFQGSPEERALWMEPGEVRSLCEKRGTLAGPGRLACGGGSGPGAQGGCSRVGGDGNKEEAKSSSVSRSNLRKQSREGGVVPGPRPPQKRAERGKRRRTLREPFCVRVVRGCEEPECGGPCAKGLLVSL